MNKEVLITKEQNDRLEKAFQMKIETDEDLIKLAEILDVEDNNDDFTTILPKTE